MKKAFHFLLILTLIHFVTPGQAQDAKQKGLDAITMQAVQGQLEFLSSDWTEGRATGTQGAYMAADYIASMFKVYGLQPGGDSKMIRLTREERMAGKRPKSVSTYFQGFNLLEYKNGDQHEMSLSELSSTGVRTTNFDYQVDFAVNASDVAMELEAPVVFVGYGIVDKESGYDDYKGVDVKGKIVITLGGYPGMNDIDSKAYKTFNSQFMGAGRSLWRHKRTQATEHGVAGIIEISPEGETPASWTSNLPFRYNSGNYEGEQPRASYYETQMKHPGKELSSSPVNISLSPRVANELLKGSGVDLETYEESVKNSMKPAAKELTGKKLYLKTSEDSKLIRAQNVVGVLPGKDTTEIIVIGAHYDHLGIHDGWIWNGADDNASGTVGVMSIAKACMATGEKPEKTIVFCAWTGEEKGLLGSSYFADHPYQDAKMLLNLNYDMISRDDKGDTLGVKCGMNYTKAYPILEELTTRNVADFDLALEVQFRPAERPRGGSDHSSFSAKDIPVMYFDAGFPPEYHQPEDHIELVNFDKMVNIIKVGYLNIWDLANTEWGPAE
ncbi:MAG: M20/M25/M40 family metallo-hydrolase [Bacteroidia bacterium]|nr:MAG: M20/M25/M40 family metallo-hydrolase [Bacteroidia bacterium]